MFKFKVVDNDRKKSIVLFSIHIDKCTAEY